MNSAMNWDDLRIFLAVARARTLAPAARSLGIDPTTVSRRLDRLAAAFGTALFEPGSAGYSLTARGQQLLVHAEAMERSAFAALGEVTGGSGLLSGTVRVSVAEGFGTWVIARHLAEFHSANPAITVELIASSGFLNPSRREADIAVMLARPKTGPLVTRRLTDYRLQLYAAQAYLDRAPPLGCAADLRAHTLIGYVPDIVYSPALDYIAEFRPGTEPDIRSSSINAQHALAVSGAGICMLPQFIGMADPRLQPVLHPEIELTRSFWLIVHKDVRQLARVAAFVDWLLALVAVTPGMAAAARR